MCWGRDGTIGELLFKLLDNRQTPSAKISLFSFLPLSNCEEGWLLTCYLGTRLLWTFILTRCCALTWVTDILVRTISSVHAGRRFPTPDLSDSYLSQQWTVMYQGCFINRLFYMTPQYGAQHVYQLTWCQILLIHYTVDRSSVGSLFTFVRSPYMTS